MSRLVTVTRLRLAELGRQPTTLALLVVLPPVVIEMYGVALASFPQLPSLGAEAATVGRLTGTLFAVAFLAGIVGLFQVIGARNGDERLAICGFPRSTMLATRLLTMVASSLVGAMAAFAVLLVRIDVAAPALAFGALALSGLVYGLLGVVVGTVVPHELEGSMVVVFLADVDNALSSGLFPVDASASLPVVGEVAVTDFVPLYHPHELFSRAVLDGELAGDHLVRSVVWITLLLVVAFAAYGRSTGEGWSDVAERWFT